MAFSFSLDKVEPVAPADKGRDFPRPAPETPFNILVLGNFSGSRRAGRGPGRKDRANFDEVVEGLGVALNLSGPGDEGDGLVLHFDELEDFHPDGIYAQVSAFEPLREMRRQLRDPASFQAIAKRLGAGQAAASAPKPVSPAPAEPAPAGDLLSQVLEQSSSAKGPKAPSRDPGHLDDFLRKITASHRTAAADPRQADLIAEVDEAIGECMRAILGHPDFRALEAAWRSLHFLTRRLETGDELDVYLLDVSKAELAEDLASAREPSSAAIHKLLVGGTIDVAGGVPWAALIADMTFAPTESDVLLLGRMAEVARAAGAPFLAAADPAFLGWDARTPNPDPDEWPPLDPEFREIWNSLRSFTYASSLGLAVPRFLLRLPYGRDNDPIDSFNFEELSDHSAVDDYLWGNGAFLAAVLLGESFSRSGWNFRPDGVLDIDDLPLPVPRDKRSSPPVACTDVVLGHRAAEIVVKRGLMPLLAMRDQDVVRLGRFQSIAEPSSPLAGRWNS
jgi:type VI secretion system protein ImpC